MYLLKLDHNLFLPDPYSPLFDLTTLSGQANCLLFTYLCHQVFRVLATSANDLMTGHKALERLWKEAIATKFKVF